jgi:hypothetical protein
METTIVKAWGTEAAAYPLEELTIKRRQPTAHDVEIDIFYIVAFVIPIYIPREVSVMCR